MFHSFETHGPIELRIEVTRGKVTLVSADTTATDVTVNGERADEVQVFQDGDTVSVIAPKVRMGFFGADPSYDVQVTLPHESELSIKTGSADVTAQGRFGSSDLRSGSGQVEVEHLIAQAIVETGSGDINLHRVDGELRIKAGSGDISVGQTSSAVMVTAGSGDVEFGTTAGPTVVKTGSGDLRVAIADGDLAMSTGSGDATVNRLNRGRFSLKGASGDLRIGIPRGVPVWTDISAVSGSVRSDLASAGEPADGQDFIELVARTVSGDITLKQLQDGTS